MKLVYLPKDEAILKTLASWTYNEWLQSNPNASIERMTSLLSDRAESTQIPLSIVALNEQGQPAGIASLMAADMKSHPELSPWLSGVYVHPQERGKGIGSALCERVIAEARRLEIFKIYLVTQDQQRLYSRLGWKAVFDEFYNGSQVTVMEFDLGPDFKPG